jgi:3-methylfumaryl-CoA hydratase
MDGLRALVSHWRSWIGRNEARLEVLDENVLRRFATALGEDLDVVRAPPPLAHWAFFLPTVAADELGNDGHPKRGGLLPPITLARRMFAASDIAFDAPLRLNEKAELRSAVVDVVHKSGKSGDLIFVELERELTQREMSAVRERQVIVYRDAGSPLAPVNCAPQSQERELWTPGPVELFRFSAATFNSHRIHYDLQYARQSEGYPDLVVQGPLVAARLFAVARQAGEIVRFNFRALASVFVSQPIAFESEAAKKQVRAIRCDGAMAMVANYEIEAK